MKRKICKFMAGLLVVSLIHSASDIHVSASNIKNAFVNVIVTEMSEEEAFAADDVTITDDAAEITDNINGSADVIEEVGTEDAADSEIAEDILLAGAQSIVEAENVTAVYSLYSIWESGYTLGIEIKNNGDEALRNWAAILPIKGEVASCWGTEIIASIEDNVSIKHLAWNAEILPGASVSLGMNVNGTLDAMPSSFSLIRGDDVCIEGISSSLTIAQEWDGGFNALLEVVNNGETIESDWQIEFDYDNELNDFWGGNIVSQENNHYVVKPYWIGRSFNNGEVISFGFQVLNGDKECEIKNVKVTTHVCEEKPEEDDWNPGEGFVKEPSEADIVCNEETEERYVRNQVLVGVMLGIDQSLVEIIAAELGATIVGYIPLSEMYQLEFAEEKDYDQLYEVIEELESYSFVNYAILNYAEEIEYSYYPSEGYTDNWNVAYPDGQNWGLEAMRVPGAWDRRAEFTGKTKVGVLDSDFDENHPDVQFKKLQGNYLISDEDDHGTHVSGIIGATFDNGIGVSGVATNVDLYGYSKKGLTANFATESQQLTALITSNIKVINISYSYVNTTQYKVSIGNTATIKSIEREAKALSGTLKNLLLSGYDFLIVNAAGNASDRYFLKNGSSYEEVSLGTAGASYLQYADAKYSYIPNAIDDELVKSHILVVGAVEHVVSSGFVDYYVSNYSGRGNRVDIYAPGTKIYSTINTNLGGGAYGDLSGTSMAAPHVTGLAALIWQANPMLTSLQVKNIILSSKGHGVKEHNNSDVFYMPDAEKCIDAALSFTGSSSASDMPKGTITGKVTDTDGNVLSGITVSLVRTSAGQANLSEYYYTTTTNASGEYEAVVIAGTYEVDAYDSNSKYLPVRVSGQVVSPEETRYVETIKMGPLPTSVWWSRVATIQGKVYNAINGRVVSDAKVNIRSGWNNCEGQYCKSQGTKADSSGYFELETAYGNYTVEVSKDGYIVGYFNVVSVKSESGAYETMVLTPVLDENEYRIILTWDADPRDLDSHLTYYDSTGAQKMHVYFSNRTGYINGVNVAQLDVDDTSGYGPETITMTLNAENLQNGEFFRYSVHKYSGNNTLATSNAIVRLYSGNSLIDTYSVPSYFSDDKNVWQVFKITESGVSKINIGKTVFGAGNVE